MRRQHANRQYHHKKSASTPIAPLPHAAIRGDSPGTQPADKPNAVQLPNARVEVLAMPAPLRIGMLLSFVSLVGHDLSAGGQRDR